MPFRRIGLLAIALAVTSTTAFQGTSPLFVFSTSRLAETGLEGSQLGLASNVQTKLSNSLEICPSDSYVIVSQPGVSASDFTAKTSAPNLRRWVHGAEEKVKSAWTVPEVYGQLDADKLARSLANKCGVQVVDVDASAGFVPVDKSGKRVLKVEFPELPLNSERASKLVSHDSFLNAVLQPLSGHTVTVIYTTTPPASEHDPFTQHAAQIYEMDDPYPSSVHMDFKRDVSARADNSTLNSNLPLFEKYQFLSPAIFMGLMVTFILAMIMYVGLTALGSLEVSYFAFSKEMGPAGQKKQ
ncbi:BIG1-domain-containing protein [Aulographum hederae CBS 113979]|uniref:Protein BIG1 n=1 Tax=Aulographum hederae CBS 113979 TaxID=1176131 RepID=A0A6G1GUE3_9PEZI|nr:BIG1-domain-containing protein [Aulographum hederae CBS 113979]